MPRRLKSANTVSATATLDLHTTEALFKFKDALYDSMQDVFSEILFEAVERSPVLAHATSEREVGQNRESLRDSVKMSLRGKEEGVRARIFTTSGYGGWLELGTVKTRPQPYIYPAFEAHIGELPGKIKEILG